MYKEFLEKTLPQMAAAPDGIGAWRPSNIGGVVLLIAFADFLFWGYRPGATLGIFAIAVFAVAAARHGTLTGLAKPALLMGLAALPVLEHVQALSVVILFLGAICSLAWLRVVPKDGVEWIAAAAIKLIAIVPFAGLATIVAAWRDLRKINKNSDSSRSKIFWRNWSVPMGGALVLGALLLTANPVLERTAQQLFQMDLDLFVLVQRTLFWCGLGLLIWPLLNPPEPHVPTSVIFPTFEHHFGLNGGSVLRALMVFNVFLAVQTVLDFSILLGNAALPSGMTYATYAHRGAYPLMITAMLAGAFAIAARPFLKDHRAFKPLLILWITQNVVLTLTAAMRLNLYIAEYGLTYLRVYALIWMGLIAVGLVVVLWHVARERSSFALVLRLTALSFGTLYLCAFVNFASIIAQDTIKRAADTGGVISVDWTYLCNLGPTAAKTVAQGLAAHPDITAPADLQLCFLQGGDPSNWRTIDFRKVRTQIGFFGSKS